MNQIINYEFIPNGMVAIPYIEEEDCKEDVVIKFDDNNHNPNWSPGWLKYDYLPYRSEI